MNKRDAYRDGKYFGYGAASCVDVPEVGDYIDQSVDYVGIGKRVTNENVLEYFELLCYATYESSQQNSDFSFIAHDINECHNADGLWGAFESGVNRGIAIRINEVKNEN